MSDIKKANEDELNTLHQMVAQKLMEMLKNPDASVQEVQAAMKFLKDNDVTADIKYNQPLRQLEQEVTPVGELPFIDEEEEDDGGSDSLQKSI